MCSSLHTYGLGLSVTHGTSLVRPHSPVYLSLDCWPPLSPPLTIDHSAVVGVRLFQYLPTVARGTACILHFTNRFNRDAGKHAKPTATIPLNDIQYTTDNLVDCNIRL